LSKDQREYAGITNAFQAPAAYGAYGPDDDYHAAYDKWSEHSAILDRFKSETDLDPDQNPAEFFGWLRDLEKENPSLGLSNRYSGVLKELNENEEFKIVQNSIGRDGPEPTAVRQTAATTSVKRIRFDWYDGIFIVNQQEQNWYNATGLIEYAKSISDLQQWQFLDDSNTVSGGDGLERRVEHWRSRVVAAAE
jgi:hypothetical protein